MPKKRRVQVADLNGPAPVAPQASPVDTFHAPLTALAPTGNSYADWAEGLMAFQPGLNQALGSEANRLVKTQEQAKRIGDATASPDREANKAAFKKAIADGTIREAESPWFEKGQKQGSERLRGMKFNEALIQGWTNWGGKDSTDPAAFQSWAQGFTQKYNELNPSENPLETAEVYNPMVNQSVANLEQQHVAHVKNHIEQKFRDDTYAEIGQILDIPGIHPGDIEIAKQIQNTLKYQVSLGLSGADANKLAVDAVTQKAVRAGDADVLDLLDQIDTGNGSLGKTQYATEQKDQALTNILAKDAHVATVGRAAEEDKRKKAARDIKSRWQGELLNNKFADVRPRIDEMRLIDPDQADDMITFQDKLISSDVKVYEDGGTVSKLAADVYAGVADDKAITKAANEGDISPENAMRLQEKYYYMTKEKGLFEDASFKYVESNLRRKIASDFTDINAGGTAADASNQLHSDWLEANQIPALREKFKDPVEKNKWLKERYKQLIEDAGESLGTGAASAQTTGTASSASEARTAYTRAELAIQIQDFNLAKDKSQSEAGKKMILEGVDVTNTAKVAEYFRKLKLSMIPTP